MSNIFLNRFKNKKSVNTSNGLNMLLMGKRKLLPTNDVSEVINQYNVYNEERSKCNVIRLTCQVNAVCTNTLFNSITEIVENEGNENMSFLNYGIINGDLTSTTVTDKTIYVKDNDKFFWSDEGAQEAIRDTQLSNCGFIYHCGANIFNNHLVRSKTFKAVCQTDGNTNKNKFNTIYDFLRNENGEQVVDRVYFPLSSGLSSRGNEPEKLHIYKYEDLYPYKECIENRLIKSFEGWVGFYNRPKIKTYLNFGTSEEEAMEIDRPIMYLNGGDFVDMYPDRTLYSFVPKYNTHKNRVEKNWNYCLTYPSSSYTPTKDIDPFSDVIECNNGVNSLKALYFNENTIADNGVKQLVIYSITKHGLSVGDFVNVYNTVIENGEKTTKLLLNNAEVTAIADDYIFTVFSTIQISSCWVELTDADYNNNKVTINDVVYNLYNKSYFVKEGDISVTKYYLIDGTRYANFDENAQHISYKKVVNGIECDYYVRIFSKIPNFKFASADTSSEYEIYKNDGELIKEYQQKKYDFESHVSRLAFAKNVYSDSIGEIVFTDNIDISNLRDNLGRPLSNIYLTIIKNNSGYKEWYGFSISDIGDWNVTEALKNNVEYSHCFGKVTCGIQTSEETRYDNSINSINRINNIGKDSSGFNVDKINGDRDEYDVYDDQYGDFMHYSNYYIDMDEVWFNLDKNYYGDLSCYDNYHAIESQIQPILHRFNTAQRESDNSKSRSYFYSFKYDEIKHDDYDYESFKGKDERIINCNNKKEGYYYNPHYEIPIKTFGELNSIMPDFLTLTKINPYNDSVRFTVLENHNLSVGDKTILYDNKSNKYYHCKTITGFATDYKSYICKMYDDNDNIVFPINIFTSDKTVNDFKIFKIDNLDVPTYARVLKDGTCRIIWRNIINNGFDTNNDSVEKYPFTNGAFYVNKIVNLYLRRQDPYGIWGLYSNQDVYGADINIEEEDNYVKDNEIVC